MNRRRAERNKEELRKLALHPDNKTCFNCTERGPQYVVTDFAILVCTNCSAIHRSLQHKVKGISASDFTDEEVEAVRAGGNGKAHTIWKATWSGSSPAAGNTQAITHAIRQCFVEKRFYVGPPRSSPLLPTSGGASVQKPTFADPPPPHQSRLQPPTSAAPPAEDMFANAPPIKPRASIAVVFGDPPAPSPPKGDVDFFAPQAKDRADFDFFANDAGHGRTDGGVGGQQGGFKSSGQPSGQHDFFSSTGAPSGQQGGYMSAGPSSGQQGGYMSAGPSSGQQGQRVGASQSQDFFSGATKADPKSKRNDDMTFASLDPFGAKSR